MNKIINGKKYNPETADLVAKEIHYENSNYAQNCYYRKKTGEFFKYHESNGLWGTKYIQPLSLSEAKEEIEEILDADDYELIFGEVSE